MKFYSVRRLWYVFRLLLSFYLLIKKRNRFLGFAPLKPQKLTQVVIELGTSFIKLVQVLATRNDFFDETYLSVLRTIHDDLPPMPSKAFERVFQRAFPSNPFVAFDVTPIASASIGQVHQAKLHDGTVVAVKLRRDTIEAQVKADIRIITFFNALFRPLFSSLTRHSVEAVISEFSAMIIQECSMNQERQNLQRFSALYSKMGVRFPHVYPQWCSDDALVMSFEEGFRFDDEKQIKAHRLDITPIIDKLIHFYTEQMLVKGYFHADPHPGNLRISSQGELILLDFGMVKRLSNPMRVAIIELIRAAHEKDFEAYINAAKRMGTVSYDAPSGELAEFAEKMFEIFGDEALDSGSMQKLAFDVMESTRNVPFKLPQEAIYILRVSAIIEGLGTTYIENFNGIKDILPILQHNIPKALGLKDSFLENLTEEIKHIPDDLTALRHLLRQASQGALRVELAPLQVQNFEERLERLARPLQQALMMALGATGCFGIGWDSGGVVLMGTAIIRLWMK